MPFIDEIFYDRWSYPVAGRTITLINGYGRPCTDFRSLGKSLVQANMAVVTLDNRGAGRSIVSCSFTLNDMVADILTVWKQLEIKTSAVLGISMGGAVAQLLALDSPEKVTKLILVSSFALQDFAVSPRRKWPEDLPAMQKRLASYVAPTFFAKNKSLITAMAKQMIKEKQTGNLQDKAIADFVPPTQSTSIGCPVLVVHGEEDSIVPVQTALKLKCEITQAILTLLPDAGHLLLLEKPDALLDQIVKFCSNRI